MFGLLTLASGVCEEEFVGELDRLSNNEEAVLDVELVGGTDDVSGPADSVRGDEDGVETGKPGVGELPGEDGVFCDGV